MVRRRHAPTRKVAPARPLRIGGLDPSLTGACLVVVEYSPVEQRRTTIARATLPDPGNTVPLVPRVAAIGEALRTMLVECRPHAVIVEGYGFSRFTAERMVSVGYQLRRELHDRGIPFVTAPPMSLKKFTTGGGRAAKGRMMQQVLKRWGFEAATDDEADAYALAMFGYGMLAPHAIDDVNGIMRDALDTCARSNADDVANCKRALHLIASAR